MKIAIILVTLLSFLIFLYREIKKQIVLKINKYVKTKEYRQLEALLLNPFNRLFFSSSSIIHIQLEAAILEEDKERVESYTEKLLNRNLSQLQKSDLYFQIFDFYVKVKDKKKSKEYLNKINQLNDEELVENANMIFSIMVEQKDEYLSKLLKRVEDKDDFQRAYLEFLIAEIYKNKKNHRKEKEYRERSVSHLRETSTS